VVREAGVVIQDIGTPVPALLIAGIGMLLLLRSGRPGEPEGLLVAGSATVACALLKEIFGPTPVWTMLHPGSGANYPSGHVTFAAATIGYLGLCAWRHGLPRITALAVVLILCVGPERILSGVHTVSDIIAGYLLAGSWLILADLCVRSGYSVLPRVAVWGAGSG
jgi:undecaprenyl-diphosphatase